MHEPNLAARFCDHLLLLHRHGAWALGPAAEVLTAAQLSRLYGHPVSEVRHVGGRAFVAA